MIHIPYSHIIATIYGPFAINIYGSFIALALLICMKLIPLNKRYAQLKLDNYFISIILVCIVAAIAGGRLLAIISEPTLYHHWYEWFMIWNGGFSALGSILGVTVGAYVYLKKINLPVLPVFDLMAIYAPLFQSIARLGCLFAGCCYGKPTHFFLHIIYTDKDTIAPHHIALHPTQLYSSALLFLIFLCMYFIIQRKARHSGQLFLTYFMLASAERFIVDFWRADRIIVNNYFLSFHQIIALVILFFSAVITFMLSVQKRPKNIMVPVLFFMIFYYSSSIASEKSKELLPLEQRELITQELRTTHALLRECAKLEIEKYSAISNAVSLLSETHKKKFDLSQCQKKQCFAENAQQSLDQLQIDKNCIVLLTQYEYYDQLINVQKLDLQFTHFSSAYMISPLNLLTTIQCNNRCLKKTNQKIASDTLAILCNNILLAMQSDKSDSFLNKWVQDNPKKAQFLIRFLSISIILLMYTLITHKI